MRGTVEERFWAKVDRTGNCWTWTASRDSKWGYGFFRVTTSGTMKKAHRVAWEIVRGPIPDGLSVCHCCDNPSCVRPAHLFLGTHQDNMSDRNAKGRCSRMVVHRGEKTPSSILTEAQVAKIRRLYAAGGVLQRELAERFGVSQSHVGRLVRGDRWNPGGAVPRRAFIDRRNDRRRKAAL